MNNRWKMIFFKTTFFLSAVSIVAVWFTQDWVLGMFGWLITFCICWQRIDEESRKP